MSENGPSDFDELNKVDAGWNGGWNKIHGPDALDPQGTGDLWNMPNEGLTYSDPEFSWQQVQVPTGVNFPFNTSWGPPYNTKVLVGTQSGDIYSFPLNATRTISKFISRRRFKAHCCSQKRKAEPRARGRAWRI